MLSDDQKAALMESVGKTGFTSEPSGDVLTVDASAGGTVTEIKTEDVTIEESSTPQVEQSVEAKASEEVAETDDSPQTQKGHNVPYKRFKNVLDARNNFRNEVDGYKQKLSSLEQKLANLEKSSKASAPQAQPAAESNWLDDFLQEDTQTAAGPEWQQQYSQLNDRLYQFEVAREEQKIREELVQVQSQYPNVPPQLILKAIVQDPDVNIFELAESYNSHFTGIEENAIARYIKEHGGTQLQAEDPDALVRPRTTPSIPTKAMMRPAEKPSSVKGASKALRDLLSKDNFLK